MICQICLVSKQAKTRHDATLQAKPTTKDVEGGDKAIKKTKNRKNMAEPLLNTGDTMWSLLENVSEKRAGVENFNSDARDVLQARVNGGFVNDRSSPWRVYQDYSISLELTYLSC